MDLALLVHTCAALLSLMPATIQSTSGDAAAPTVTKVLVKCDFETDCSFTQVHSGDQDHFNWTRHSGPTDTDLTGPSNDHTYRNSSGYYMYIETSATQYNERAIYLSPHKTVRTGCTANLSFYYNMYGKDVNALSAFKVVDGIRGWSEIWSKDDEQHSNGETWDLANFTAIGSNVSGKSFHLAFIGYSGGSELGDIAIDDVVVMETCPECCVDHTCTMKDGNNYDCTCKRGYENNGPQTCVDIDECNTRPNVCGIHTCENTKGSYVCRCNEHFHNVNPKLCREDCASGVYCVGHTCKERGKTYTCRCSAGYKNNGPQTCVDIDECEPRPNVCGIHKCENTAGSYICHCNEHFRNDILSQYKLCREDCASGVYCVNHTCTDRGNTYVCTCRPGYENNDPHNCAEIDECKISPSVCGIHRCENTDGSYLCHCNGNFHIASPHLCREDCTSGVYCGDHTCTETNTTYTCTCNAGYENNGTQECVDTDECSPSNDACGIHKCENTDGSYICHCEDHFHKYNSQSCREDCGSGVYCVGHTCTETDDSYFCTCRDGYKNNGPQQCVDIDECEPIPNVCGIHTCSNTPGSYVCHCKESFYNYNSQVCMEKIENGPDDFESKVPFFPEPIAIRVFAQGISWIVVVFIAINGALLLRTIVRALYRFITTRAVYAMVWDDDSGTTGTGTASLAQRWLSWGGGLFRRKRRSSFGQSRVSSSDYHKSKVSSSDYQSCGSGSGSADIDIGSIDLGSVRSSNDTRSMTSSFHVTSDVGSELSFKSVFDQGSTKSKKSSRFSYRPRSLTASSHSSPDVDADVESSLSSSGFSNSTNQ